MPSLKNVDFGFNKFCGPAVLSIVTGRNTDDCAYAISSVTSRYEVRGVYLADLMKAANKLGFDTINANVSGSSLFQSLLTLAPRGDGIYIVAVTGHFVCVEVSAGKLYFCDNHTKEPIPAASSARLSMTVEAAYKVVKNENFKAPEPPKSKPVFVAITRWQCKECNAIGADTRYIIHEPDCKWRGYDIDGNCS